MAHPPIPWGLSREQECEAFERLKPRLLELWKEVFPREDEPYAAVIVPSVSVEPDELGRRPGARFYEEALLFLLIRLRNPRARIVYLTSEPLPQPVLEYYFQFLAGIPVSHASARLTLLSPHDSSPRPLAEKILERPRLVERIRAAIPNLARAYLTVFRATPLERRLAVLLGIPLNAADPGMEALCTKSATRPLLREAGIEVPEGSENLRDETDILEALGELRRRRPGLKRALLKLNESPWAEGDAVLHLPQDASRAALERALAEAAPVEAEETPATYFELFRRRGGVVEEFVEGTARIASGQVRINPQGQVRLASTHDEIRSGPDGLAPAGCVFPADDAYRCRVQEASLRVGKLLAAKGLVSRLSVEFMVLPGEDGGPRLLGTEVNLGVGGATHPLLAVRFLLGGALDPASGLFLAPTGQPKFYRATDHLGSPAYRGFTPPDLIEIVTLNGLNYSPRTEAGCLFYMLGGISEVGRIGVVAIGSSREQAEAGYRHAVETLDRESRALTESPGQKRSHLGE